MHRLLGLLCVIGLAAPGALAQPVPDSALVEALRAIEGVPLSLDEALDLARRNATVLGEARSGVAAAEAALRRERGAFDPELLGLAQRTRTEQPSASAFSGADVLTTRDLTGQAGLRSLLPTGTEIQLSLNTITNRTNSRFSALNPQYNAFGELTVRHPLLAGSGPAARAAVRAASHELAAEEARLGDIRRAVRELAEDLYWSLYAAERDLAVQRVIRDNAASLVDEARLRAEAGLVGPNQVQNARVFLAEQDLAVLDREEELDRLSDELSVLLGVRPPDGATRFRPADPPPVTAPLEPVDALVEQAVRANPAVRAARFDLEAIRARLDGARRDRLPSVDLVGAVRSAGLAGSGRAIVFGADTLLSPDGGDYFEAWRQIGAFNFPRWNVGVDVRWPLGTRSRRGEADRWRALLEQAELRLEALTRDLEQLVRLHHRALTNADLRLEHASAGVEAAQEQVRIGLIEYRNGRSTAFELVRLGADLAAAQQRYSQAVVRTARAAAALRRLTDTGAP